MAANPIPHPACLDRLRVYCTVPECSERMGLVHHYRVIEPNTQLGEHRYEFACPAGHATISLSDGDVCRYLAWLTGEPEDDPFAALDAGMWADVGDEA